MTEAALKIAAIARDRRDPVIGKAEPAAKALGRESATADRSNANERELEFTNQAGRSQAGTGYSRGLKIAVIARDRRDPVIGKSKTNSKDFRPRIRHGGQV